MPTSTFRSLMTPDSHPNHDYFPISSQDPPSSPASTPTSQLRKRMFAVADSKIYENLLGSMCMPINQLACYVSRIPSSHQPHGLQPLWNQIKNCLTLTKPLDESEQDEGESKGRNGLNDCMVQPCTPSFPSDTKIKIKNGRLASPT